MHKLQSIISAVAPFIGTMIGGPLGGAAMKTLSNALFNHDNASESEIEEALSISSPEILVKLRRIDADYKKKMLDIGIDEKKIAAMDRDSARHREIELKDQMPAILAILLTCGFFSILIFIIAYSIPSESKEVVYILLGALSTAWVSVINYYFGSSSGSNLKTRIQQQSKSN